MSWFGSDQYDGPSPVDRRLRLRSTSHARRQPLPVRRLESGLTLAWEVPLAGGEEDPISDVEDWLADLHERCSQGATDSAVDLIISGVGGLVERQAWERCDSLLERVEVRRLPPAVLLSILAETSKAREHLPRWEALRHDVAERFQQEMPPDKVQRLLARLK